MRKKNCKFLKGFIYSVEKCAKKIYYMYTSSMISDFLTFFSSE